MQRQVRAMWSLLLLLMACSPTHYTTVAQCEGIASGAGQDTCWADVLPTLFRTDSAKADGLTQTRVSDVRVRDYIYLTVTRDVDPGTMKYCDKIQEPAMKDRCRVLVSRPHLHRELSGGGSGLPAQPFQPEGRGPTQQPQSP